LKGDPLVWFIFALFLKIEEIVIKVTVLEAYEIHRIADKYLTKRETSFQGNSLVTKVFP